MAFTVIWMRGLLPMGTKTFEGFHEAASFAENNLPQIQSSYGASAVKIVDDAGIPHYLKSLSRGG